MAKTRKKLKISSNDKQINIKQCYVAISPLILNDENSSSVENISQVLHNHTKLCELGPKKRSVKIRKCKVQLNRIISTTSKGSNVYTIPTTVHNLIGDKKLVNENYSKIPGDNLKEVQLENNLKNKRINDTQGNQTTYINSMNDKTASEEDATFKLKHNINKEIQIKLYKSVKENENIEKLKKSEDMLKSKINRNEKKTDFVEENNENLNHNKRKRRNEKVKLIDNKKEYQSKKNSDKLSITQNDKLHPSDKRLLRNKKKYGINPYIKIVTRQRKNNLSNAELEGSSGTINLKNQVNSNRKNKIISEKVNKPKKADVAKLNKILEVPTFDEINKSSEVRNDVQSVVGPNLDERIDEVRENTTNYNSIPIEIQKQTFFRGLQSNNYKKQDSQKNQTKSNKIKSAKTKKSSSSMEEKKTTKTKKIKSSNQVNENTENIDLNNKLITRKELTKLSNLGLTMNNLSRKIDLGNNTTDNGKIQLIMENNTTDNGKIIKTDSKEKLNLSESEISVILDEDFEDNLMNEDSKRNISESKKFFKSPPKSRRTVSVQNYNDSDIFSFQSSGSDSEFRKKQIKNDDVIEKLVKQGKVEVAKYKKGTGRLNLKRNKKQKAPVRKKERPVTSIKIEYENTRNATEVNVKDIFDIQVERETSFSPKQKDIGFSPLARLAMKKHAHFNSRIENNMQTRQPVVDKKKLLDAAKAFLIRTSNVAKKNVNVPIQKQDNLMISSSIIRKPFPFNASTPWRSPNLECNFTYQPSPPSLNLKTKPSSLQFSDKSFPSNYSHEKENSAFNNLSNIENIQPENKNLIRESNPRKGISDRTPLKNINILEVITLPSLAFENSMYKMKTLDSENTSLNDNKSEDYTLPDMFNFEDIITDTDHYDSKLVLPKKRNLKDKLKKLKRLLPNKNSNSISKPTRMTFNSMKKLYTTNSPVKQKKIQEMFCSTMIEKNAEKEFNGNLQEKFDDSIITQEKKIDETTQKTNDYSEKDLHLFDDFSEQSTFTSSIRTYSRPKKRKKMRHEFITCLTSESEDEEDFYENHKKLKKKPNEKKEKSEEDDLNKFYAEFNSMIEDVNEYEIMTTAETIN